MNNFTSIIIINWNGVRFLTTAISSLYRFRNKTPFEIIIVDNGSTDKSVKYIKRITHEKSNIIAIFNKDNKGFTVANNQGIEAATGKYVMLLNNDIEIRGSEWLDKMINFLIINPEAGVIGPRGGILTKSLEFIGIKPNEYNGMVDYIEGWCFLFKRSLAEKIKLCREELWDMKANYLCEEMFIFAEDSEFCQRSKMLGHECYQIGNVPIHHFGNSTIKHQVKENPDADYDYKDVSNDSTQILKNLLNNKQLVNTDIKKILIMRGNARGDVLNTTPAIKALRKKHPDAFIGFVCFYPSFDILNLNHDLDCVFPVLEETIHGFHPKLLQFEWDEIYHLGDKMFPSMKTVIDHFYNSDAIIDTKHELMASQDVSTRMKRGAAKKPYSKIFAEMINIELDDLKPTLNISSKVINDAKKLLQHLDKKRKTVALCLDSHWITRTYPIPKRTNIIHSLLKEYNVVLLGISSYRFKTPEANHFVNLLNRTSIELLCAILNQIDAIVTIDTLTLHIGLAYKKPMVSLWNITEPFHVMSYQPKNQIKLFSDLACSPCYLEVCTNHNYACYNQLFPERIVDALHYLIKDK